MNGIWDEHEQHEVVFANQKCLEYGCQYTNLCERLSEGIDLGGVVVARSEVASVLEVDSGYGGPDRTVAIVTLRNGEKHRVQYNRGPSYADLLKKLGWR